MAHRGKRYKLQFRRDLTLNRFQTLGLGEAYTIEMLCVRANPPGIAFHYTAPAFNLDKSSNNDRTWSSEFFQAGSRRWKFRVTILDAWKYPQAKLRWEIEDEVAGVIYRSENGQNTEDSDRTAFGSTDQGTPDFKKNPYPSGDVGQRSNAVVMTYATYDP